MIIAESLKRGQELVPEAFTALQKVLADLGADTPVGKQEIIDGKLFVIVQEYNTHAPDAEKLEIHEEFADLQMLLSGRETIFYAPVDGLPCVSAYDAEKDCAFFRADLNKLQPVELYPGNFTIFFPGEGHMPGCGDGTAVIKAVIKIHRSLFR